MLRRAARTCGGTHQGHSRAIEICEPRVLVSQIVRESRGFPPHPIPQTQVRIAALSAAVPWIRIVEEEILRGQFLLQLRCIKRELSSALTPPVIHAASSHSLPFSCPREAPRRKILSQVHLRCCCRCCSERFVRRLSVFLADAWTDIPSFTPARDFIPRCLASVISSE